MYCFQGAEKRMNGRISPVRLKEMICLAEFEDGVGRRFLRICQYGRSGYIALQMIRSFFCITAAAALIVLMILSRDPEGMLFSLQNADWGRLLPEALIFYLLAAAAYLTVTYMRAAAVFDEAAAYVSVYEERIRMLLRFPDHPEGS